MASIASDHRLAPPTSPGALSQVSRFRLYVLRAAYLLIVVGLGATIVPGIVSHPLADRGVIPALLGAVWLLAFVGLRYPLAMLPLLLFELAWKAIWLISYGLPKWSAGALTPVVIEDLQGTILGVVVMPLVIPWGYVWRTYVRRPAEPWS